SAFHGCKEAVPPKPGHRVRYVRGFTGYLTLCL
ncbi:uncharacterized protein METZ01_LOCUS301186, partial [marine metagenome]